MMEFQKAYERVPVIFNCTGESKTKSDMQDECDINKIMSRHAKTGLVSHVSKYQGSYEDLVDVVDFHTAQNVMLEAQEAFDSLPSGIRKKFENDPSRFLEFATNPDNEGEMGEMGLIPTAPVVAPVEVVVTNPEPDAGAS